MDGLVVCQADVWFVQQLGIPLIGINSTFLQLTPLFDYFFVLH